MGTGGWQAAQLHNRVLEVMHHSSTGPSNKHQPVYRLKPKSPYYLIDYKRVYAGPAARFLEQYMSSRLVQTVGGQGKQHTQHGCFLQAYSASGESSTLHSWDPSMITTAACHDYSNTAPRQGLLAGWVNCVPVITALLYYSCC